MSKIKVMVVEDELVVSMMICDFLEELGYEVPDPVTNYESAIECFSSQSPDIVLLDIQLNGEKSGIDLAAYIKESTNIPFIFLTSKADPRTINHAKNLNPHAYLVKPFNRDDLFAAIELALHNFNTSSKSDIEKEIPKTLIKDAFFVKGTTGLFRKVNFTEITYIKSEHVYLELFTNDDKIHLIRSTMKSIMNSLPANFYRVHRSYIVNLDYLESINTLFIVVHHQKIPISKNYRDKLMQLIEIK